MYTIIGLRNPGDAYEGTRHNAGAIAVAFFGEQYHLPSFVSSGKFVGEISEGVIEGKSVRALLPNTFMNQSGSVIKKAELMPEEVVLVYDDIDLPIGSFKISHERGSGGHNGVKSIIDALGTTAFTRVRIGISPKTLFGTMRKPESRKVADFVLGTFSSRERAKLESMLPKIAEAIQTIVTKSYTEAMNKYN